MGEVKKDPWVQFKEALGATDDIAERYVKSDIAYPASEEEYSGLSGNAVVMIMAVSQHLEELPLTRAYFKTEVGEETELRNLVTAEKITKTKFGDSEKDCFLNISFWGFPIHLMLDESGVLGIDFKENRKSFSVCRGPWLIDERNQEYMKKHSQGVIKIAERLNNDILEKFLWREFINRI